MEALQASNAALADDPITQITETGIRTDAANVHQDLDILVLAAGFRNNRVPPWTMRGKNGVVLSDLWAKNPDGYLSIVVPQMPNYFTIGCGPNFAIANGLVRSALGFVADYIFKWTFKIAGEGVTSVTVKSDVTEAWNVYVQEIIMRTAWNDRRCGSVVGYSVG